MALTAADYVTLADLQAEGLLSGVDINDPDDPAVIRAASLVRQAARAVDRFTRSWFYDRTFAEGSELYLDGRGGEVLHLPAPIISVERVEVDETDAGYVATWTESPVSSLAIYDSERDWQNPKIVWKRPSGTRIPGLALEWPQGRKNVRLRCHLGHLESGDTPVAIQRAVIRLADVERELIGNDAGAQARAQRGARITSFATHNRSVTYMDHVVAGAFTGDPIIDGALARYRRPFA